MAIVVVTHVTQKVPIHNGIMDNWALKNLQIIPMMSLAMIRESIMSLAMDVVLR